MTYKYLIFKSVLHPDTSIFISINAYAFLCALINILHVCDKYVDYIATKKNLQH